MTYPPIIVAIDGFSSCGKSTLATALAKKLHFDYFDSGAMYRAVSLYCLQESIHYSEHDKIEMTMGEIDIRFKMEKGYNRIYLNEVDVTDAIRDPSVSDYVSEVSTIRGVRARLVEQQQKLGEKKRVVMDGRDIGSIVFPKAEVKLFVKATIEERTNRRYKELLQNGRSISRNEVRANLNKRDRIDATREVGPLLKSEDAIEIDNTFLSHEEQLDLAMRIIDKYIVKNKDGKA